MKTKSTKAAFFNLRILIGFALCSAGFLLAFTSLSKSATGTAAASPDTNAHHQHHHYKLIDIGTFGGPESFINASVNIFPPLNMRGMAVGGSATSVATSSTSDFFVCGGPEGLVPNVFHGFKLQNGMVRDLGNLGDCASKGHNINSWGQVVGATFLCDGSFSRAFLWENGAILDLDTVTAPGARLRLVWAMAINDRGEIAGIGVPPGVRRSDLLSQGHAFLLIPCDENHPGIEGCDYSLVEAPAAVNQPAPAVQNASRRPLPPSLLRRMSRYHFPGRALGAR